MQLPFIEHGLKKKQSGSRCCHADPQVPMTGLPLVAIVGSPNVGKSVLFNALTGAYVTVSNYPGTTVEVARGKGRLGELEIMNNPGHLQKLMAMGVLPGVPITLGSYKI